MEEEKKTKEKPIEESLIRILSTDIPGGKTIYSGLTRIKGVSWSFSNAICNVLKIDRKKRIQELKDDEIKKITEFIKSPSLPEFILNRRKDFTTGVNKHLSGPDVDLEREFDIKRLKKIKSYRGFRHALGQPTRGQRTKGHFRKNKAVGVVGKGKGKK
tara:strand:- start:3386 stop:3859 length:474 start_codon:yes stop_codon:yes gene_type:complete